ncbi:NADP-dependent oxidoreductase [Streptomyces sp. NPDC048282]|uniref:NADP-dependent oxidoreductase n=1 Tax=unclassified Streptomyces TaxID=2593676 RepID=UPI0037163670
MKALQLSEYGVPDGLQFTDIAEPSLGEGEVLVRPAATSVNPLDLKLMSGSMRSFVELDLPWTPGHDVAGVVEAVGPGVTGIEVRARVAGFCGRRAGAFAERVVLGPDSTVASLPTAVSYEQAAAVTMVGLMASAVLRAAERITAGSTVLIIGAAGGVGSVLSQLCVRAGAQVITADLPGTAPYLSELGVHRAIELDGASAAASLRESRVHDVDTVIDLVHHGWQQTERFTDVASLVKPGGQLLSTLHGPQVREDITLSYVSVDAHRPGDLEQVLAMVAAGELRQRIDTRPFEDAIEAITAVGAGKTTGKIVLTR